MKFINQDISTGENNNTSNNERNENSVSVLSPEENGGKGELEFNKNNRESFEKLMSESSTDKDTYWDKNNPFVKLILLILAVVIVVGALYYIIAYMNK